MVHQLFHGHSIHQQRQLPQLLRIHHLHLILLELIYIQEQFHLDLPDVFKQLVNPQRLQWWQTQLLLHSLLVQVTVKMQAQLHHYLSLQQEDQGHLIISGTPTRTMSTVVDKQLRVLH